MEEGHHHLYQPVSTRQKCSIPALASDALLGTRQWPGTVRVSVTEWSVGDTQGTYIVYHFIKMFLQLMLAPMISLPANIEY